MSIASEIQRISSAKAEIKAAINSRGGTLTTELLGDYAAAVTALPAVSTGGGFGSAILGPGTVLSESILESGGVLNTQYGTTLNNITVSSGATLELSTPGADDDHGATLAGSETEIAPGTLMWNGSAFNGSVSGGLISDWTGLYRVFIGEGITVSGITLNQPYGRIFAAGGGVIEQAVIDTGIPAGEPENQANITLLDGASGLNISCGAGGRLTVYTGGNVSSVTVTSGGGLTVRGGTAGAVSAAHWVRVFGGQINNVINHGGLLEVTSGEGVNGILHTAVNSGGTMTVNSGGVASGAVITESATVAVPGGRVENLRGEGTCTVSVGAGGTISGCDIAQSAGAVSAAVGRISGTLEDAHLHVVSGGSADARKVWFYITGPSAVASNCIVESYARIQPESGAKIIGGSVGDKGLMYASGGIVSSVSMTPGADVRIDGAFGSRLSGDGGTLYLRFGGSAADCSFGGSATVIVSSAGVMSGLTLNDRAVLAVSSGGKASSTIVSGGTMTVNSGGVASSAVVYSGGKLTVSSGGTALGVTSASGATVIVMSGGTVSYA